MSNSKEYIEIVAGMTALCLDDEILYSSNSVNIFLKFFLETDTLKFLDKYVICHPELNNSKHFRLILQNKGLYDIYKNSPFDFIKNSELHFREIKSFLIIEETNKNIDIINLSHPIDFVSIDTRKLLNDCKALYLSSKDALLSFPECPLSAYSLSAGLLFSSNENNPKRARSVKSYFSELGLSSLEMQKIIEHSEIRFGLIKRETLSNLTSLEKNNILLMAFKVAGIDELNLTESEILVISKYKNKFCQKTKGSELFKQFLYLSCPVYFKFNDFFPRKNQIDCLAFFISCLKFDKKIEYSEKEKYVEILKRFSFVLSPEDKNDIQIKSDDYSRDSRLFNVSLLELPYVARFYAVVTCIDILASDNFITEKEESFLANILDTVLIENISNVDVEISFLIYLNFLINNFDVAVTAPLLGKLESHLLHRLPQEFDLCTMIHLIIFNSDFSEAMTSTMLAKLRQIYSYRGETSVGLKIANDFERSFPKDSYSINEKKRMPFPVEVFLRLAIQPEKCLELDSFKNALVELTSAHIDLTTEHCVISNQLKAIIKNLTIDFKIQNSSIDVRCKAIELACELVLADNSVSKIEHDLIDKYTKLLFINEQDSFKLTSRILTYSDLPILIHDYLNYDEYKK